MTSTPSAWLSIYFWFRDQGSLIAGTLAIAAGGIAYFGAIRAARIQAAATEKQTAALRHQNEALRRSEKRQLARTGLTSVRLLSGALEQMQSDIDCLMPLLAQPALLVQNAVAPADWRTRISKPSLSTVWSALGNCSSEVVEKYLLLDGGIEQFAKAEINGAEYMRQKLKVFDEVLQFLRDELANDAQKCNAVLAEAETN